MKNGRQLMSSQRRDDRVDVVRHDDETPELVTLAIELAERLFDNRGCGVLAQHAGTEIAIEMFLQLFPEEFIHLGAALSGEL